MHMIRGKLRTKFLISLTFVTAALTWATLYVVRYRVQVRVRETIAQELDSSTRTYLRLQAQREQSLERTSALLASLPPLKAVMTSQHAATIQDASREFWSLAGSDQIGRAHV